MRYQYAFLGQAIKGSCSVSSAVIAYSVAGLVDLSLGTHQNGTYERHSRLSYLSLHYMHLSLIINLEQSRNFDTSWPEDF